MTLIEKISRYLIWANASIWEIVETLTDDEFGQSFVEGAGSIHTKYIHLAEDTWEWFHDWHGEEPPEKEFQSMTRNELYQFIVDYSKKWQNLIDDKTVDEFIDERAGNTVVIPFDEMFFHLVNHFTYHRGQIVMGLKMFGKDVPMTDFVPYLFSTE